MDDQKPMAWRVLMPSGAERGIYSKWDDVITATAGLEGNVIIPLYPPQPALALTDISAEAKKLAPILRGMCEGGGPEEGTDIYADDYFAADGDEFVIRAAQLLERIAILQAAQLKPQDELPQTDTFVQRVPDHCDRIVWRGMYYALPRPTDAQPAQPQGEQK